MRVRDLPADQQEAIRECLRFVLESGELEGEFETRLGVTESEVRALLTSWPEIDDARNDSPAVVAINNAFNEVWNGVRVRDGTRWFTHSAVEVRALYASWEEGRGFPRPNSGRTTRLGRRN